MATQERGSVNPASQAEILASNSDIGADDLFEVRDDLDTLAGKLESMEDLFRFMAMHHDDGIGAEIVGFMFSMMNLTAAFKVEARELVDRLMVLEPANSDGEARS
jgi:hypothetical protein